MSVLLLHAFPVSSISLRNSLLSNAILKRSRHSFRPRGSAKPRYKEEKIEYIPNPTIIPPRKGATKSNSHVLTVHPLLNEPTLVIKREIEYMNLILGFEQRNIYRIYNANGLELGVFKEEENGIWSAIKRQLMRTRRPFKMQFWPSLQDYYDPSIQIERNFKFINSHVQCVLNDGNSAFNGEVVAESKQIWHMWRRKYELFAKYDLQDNFIDKFAECNSPLLSWEFYNKNQVGLISSGVDRNWSGLGLEFLTDVGTYVVRFDPNLSFNGLIDPMFVDGAKQLTAEERLALICQCISIDFDYFSRHSNSGGFMIGGYGGGDV
ncbi:hypothetical protein QEN19_004141 [Hanseniaspora menglaensis]